MGSEIDHRIDRCKNHEKSQADGLVIQELERFGQREALCCSAAPSCKLRQAVCSKKADLLTGLPRIKVDDQFWLWSTVNGHRSDSTTRK